MKTLVVQSSVCGPQDRTTIQECCLSVQQWAKLNGYDYTCKGNSSNRPLSYWAQRLQIEERHLNPTINCLVWLDYPSYDRVVWVDGDVYAWGNPSIDTSWFSIMIQRQEHNLPYPQTGIFWGMNGIKSLAEWVQNNLHANSEWINYLRSYYQHNRAPAIQDQCIIQPWIEEHYRAIDQLPAGGVHRRFIRQNQLNPLLERAEPDTFVHFVGADKALKYAMFLGIKDHYDRLIRGRRQISPKEGMAAPRPQFATRAQLAGNR